MLRLVLISWSDDTPLTGQTVAISCLDWADLPLHSFFFRTSAGLDVSSSIHESNTMRQAKRLCGSGAGANLGEFPPNPVAVGRTNARARAAAGPH
jgi:hypothetical protein